MRDLRHFANFKHENLMHQLYKSHQGRGGLSSVNPTTKWAIQGLKKRTFFFFLAFLLFTVSSCRDKALEHIEFPVTTDGDVYEAKADYNTLINLDIRSHEYLQNDDFDKAQVYAERLLYVAKELGSYGHMARAYSRLGYVEFQQK